MLGEWAFSEWGMFENAICGSGMFFCESCVSQLNYITVLNVKTACFKHLEAKKIMQICYIIYINAIQRLATGSNFRMGYL